MDQKTSTAFIAASWVALIIGFISYNIGLWNAQMALNEKVIILPYYFLDYLLPYQYKKVFATG